MQKLNSKRIASIKWSWPAIIIMMVIIAGCGKNLESVTVLDTSPKEEEESPTIPGEPSSDVVEACDVRAQESALIQGQIPDWSNLPISACYQLWLQLNDDPRNYEGKAKITYTNSSQGALDEIVFRLYPNADLIYGGNLEVISAKISDNPVEPKIFLEDETGLRLSVDEPIQPGETTVIEMDFKGRLTDGFQDAPGTYGLFNYSQDDETATYINWYPILALKGEEGWQTKPVTGIGDAVVSEVGLYLVEVAAPTDLQVIAGGSLINQQSQEGVEIYQYASGPVRDFPVVASPNFSLIQDEVDGVVINHWGLPGGEDRWEEGLKASINSLMVFNESFGAYPYRELDIAVVPLQLASGVEYPGLFLMRDDLYSDDSDRSFLLSTIISHETAHQWWYGLVGNNVIEDPWQDEALTSFSSLLYLEQFEPQVNQGTITYFEQIKDEVDRDLPNSDIGQPVEAFIQQPENYSPVVYSKGAVFFLELRKEIGDQAFFGALQDYFSSNKYKISPPESLLGAFEKSCGCELDDLYSEWGVQ